MSSVPFRYLAISNHKICPEPLAGRINKLFKLGVPAIQLRDKQVTDRQKYRWLEQIHPNKNKLLINSRVDIALLFGADGVHRAASAISNYYIKKIGGEEMIIGLSTHTVEEVKNAISLKPDYITFGPLWPTPSKPELTPAGCAGIEKLEKICEFSPVPVFALGGVKVDRISACLKAGAYGVAGIRSLFSPGNPRNNWQKIKKEIKLHSS